MAGPAPSYESVSRRTLRLALGVTLAFVIAQLINWPLAYLTPVFASLLLQEAVPQSVRQSLDTTGTALAAIFGGFLTALFLLPYPAVLVLVVVVVLFRWYLHAAMSGVHIIIFVGILVGALVMPVLVQVLPEIALIAGIGLLFDFAIAILVAWAAFLVIPASKAPPAPDHGTLSYAEAVSVAATLTVVVAPLLIWFLVFGSTKILILIYAAIIAAGMGSTASGEMGWKFVIANLVYGGVGMLLAFELLVMVPNVAFMIALMFMMCVIFGGRIFGGGPSASIWASGFIGFLLLIGSALTSDDVVTVAKLLDRVFQIFAATVYVVFAYRVVDLIKTLFSGRRTTARARSATPAS